MKRTYEELERLKLNRNILITKNLFCNKDLEVSI